MLYFKTFSYHQLPPLVPQFSIEGRTDIKIELSNFETLLPRNDTLISLSLYVLKTESSPSPPPFSRKILQLMK